MLEAADLGGLDVSTARPVLTAASTCTEGIKDPYLLRIGPVTYLFASFAAARPFTAVQRERAHSTGDIYNTGLTTRPSLDAALDREPLRQRLGPLR